MASVGQAAAYSSLFWLNTLYNNGSIVFYSGTQPASPETALSGNTALATWTLSATAFAAPAFSAGAQSAAASFVASSVAPSNSGTVTFARATPPAWAGSTAYTRGSCVSNGGNLYQCIIAGTSAASGGPSGTTNSITDGTVTWQYLASGPALVDYTVGTSGTDIIVGNTSIQTGTNVSLSLTHKVAAV